MGEEMRILEIMEKLFDWCPMARENASDIPIYGDMSRDVSKIAVCMIATPEVLRKASEIGAQFLITHEPTFHNFVSRIKGDEAHRTDPVYLAKKQLIAQLDIPIYRFHDHSHFTQIDKIHAGFIKRLGLPGSFDGSRTLILDNPISIDLLEQYLAERLRLKHIRFIGQRKKLVRTIALCAGAWGEKCVYEQLSRPEVDVVICGEICEWSICEYVRDSAQLGIDKALFVLGHMSSEKSGMEYVCQYINETMPGVTAVYIECEEVYQ